MDSNEEATRPEVNIRVGPIRAAIWNRLVTTREGVAFELKKVVLERIYRTAEGEWRTTNSFDVNDVPKAILALSRAYGHIFRQSVDPGIPPGAHEAIESAPGALMHQTAVDHGGPRRGPSFS